MSTGLLENIWHNKNHSITSTPPPSPTNSLPINSSSQYVTSKNSQLNLELESVARACLTCLTQLFSWIPLSTHVTPHLMELIFRFVAMGTQETSPQFHISTGIFSFKLIYFQFILNSKINQFSLMICRNFGTSCRAEYH